MPPVRTSSWRRVRDTSASLAVARRAPHQGRPLIFSRRACGADRARTTVLVAGRRSAGSGERTASCQRHRRVAAGGSARALPRPCSPLSALSSRRPRSAVDRQITVGADAPASWDGRAALALSDIFDPATLSPCGSTAADVCDTTLVHVSPEASGTLKFRLSPVGRPGRPTSTSTSSAAMRSACRPRPRASRPGTGSDEQVVVPSASGSYLVEAVSFARGSAGYRGAATLSARAAAPPDVDDPRGLPASLVSNARAGAAVQPVVGPGSARPRSARCGLSPLPRCRHLREPDRHGGLVRPRSPLAGARRGLRRRRRQSGRGVRSPGRRLSGDERAARRRRLGPDRPPLEPAVADRRPAARDLGGAVDPRHAARRRVRRAPGPRRRALSAGAGRPHGVLGA